jgi:hypothetical protein
LIPYIYDDYYVSIIYLVLELLIFLSLRHECTLDFELGAPNPCDQSQFQPRAIE